MTTTRLVTRFLSTVVILDDQPTYEPPPLGEDAAADIDDSPDPAAGVAPESGLIAPDVGAEHSGQAADSHDLEAGPVGHSFAEAGMVCAIVQPPVNIGQAIHRADVVVLDWRLAPGEPVGDMALRILEQLVNPDASQPLRLVCVYTGDPAINDVPDQLIARLGGQRTDQFAVTVGATKIVVLGKEHNTQCPADRRVAPADLPGRIVTEFSTATRGLVPGFAVAALGAIRENSGWLLKRFRREIDPGLLGHRVLLSVPDDCAEHLRDALTDELNSILAADRLVAASVSADECLARLDDLPRSDDEILALANVFRGTDPQEQRRAFVRDGVGNLNKADWATLMFASPEVAEAADFSFAELLQGQIHYAANAPLLTLGVVVERIAGDDRFPSGYYVCVQPLCDSVRVSEPRRFPFLPVHVPRDEAPTFIISDGGRPVPLTGSVKLHAVRMAPFMPTTENPGPVWATRIDGVWEFRDVEPDPGVYRYVARLRDVLAQRIAHQLGLDTSRVGIDDPEWMRRRRKIG